MRSPEGDLDSRNADGVTTDGQRDLLKLPDKLKRGAVEKCERDAPWLDVRRAG